jgi:hypothetical protein
MCHEVGTTTDDGWPVLIFRRSTVIRRPSVGFGATRAHRQFVKGAPADLSEFIIKVFNIPEE